MTTFSHSANSKTNLVCHGVLLGISAFTFFAAPAVNAAVVVTASEVGGNVVFSGGGTLNLADLSPTLSGCSTNGFLNPSIGIYMGGGSSGCSPSKIYGPVSGPATLGTGNPIFSDSSSGDFAGISHYNNGLVIPDTYTSGGSIFGTSTFLSQTFASLGLTAGTYDWVWGSSNPDSYRLCIGSGPCAPASSSVPGPLPLFGAGAAFGWSRRLRKRISSPLSTPPQA
jgi:hypothetical protein